MLFLPIHFLWHFLSAFESVKVSNATNEQCCMRTKHYLKHGAYNLSPKWCWYIAKCARLCVESIENWLKVPKTVINIHWHVTIIYVANECVREITASPNHRPNTMNCCWERLRSLLIVDYYQIHAMRNINFMACSTLMLVHQFI